jgi:hypothetical protein
MSFLRLPARASFWLCVIAIGCLCVLTLTVANLAHFCAIAGGYMPSEKETT